MVFAARDATLDREVALKILSEDYSRDERRIAAFEEEARITASLSHPNVVKVFKTGRAFGRFYIAMEMVPGGHMEQRIREAGQIPERELLPLAIEVARGLKAAHAAGLIHRDVKPGNILIDASGHGRLVDFGLALVTQGGKALASELWATPYYVPPETIEGMPEDLRSDIYAFGATLYHALSGRPPCGEESMATDALREAKKKIIPLSKAGTQVSAETCRIVDRAMSYDPVNRYASYDELIDDLRKSLARAKSGSGADESGPSRRRSRRTRLIVAAAGLAVVVIVTSVAVMSPRGGEKPVQPAATATPKPTVVSTKPQPDVDPSADIARLHREARAALEKGDYATAELGFAALNANEHVLEPTRSWAALESVLAAFIDGRPRDGRRRARAALDHLASLPQGHPLSGEEWRGLLSGIGNFRPLTGPPISEPAAAVLASMMSGLKNWEQGMLEPAARCFAAAAETQLGPECEWAAIYQKMARDYLADYELLGSPVFVEEPKDRAGCEVALARLRELRGMLKTRGRSRFNTDAWQHDLQRRALRFAVAEKGRQGMDVEISGKQTEEPTLEEVLKRIAELTDTWRFVEAVEYLRGLPADLPGAQKSALLALTQDAADFPEDLERDLAREAYQGPLVLKSGGNVQWLGYSEDGALNARLDDGSTVPCSLADLTADALINLHRALVRNSDSEAERLRRHQCAIAYDWLAGNRERALSAAAMLSQGSPEFQQRWQDILSGLPQ